MPITKHNYTVRRVEDLADTMRAASRIAQSGRKGPVLVDIPKDITAATCEFTPKAPELIRTVTCYDEDDVLRAAELINAAERPLIYFGGGVCSAAGCQPLRDLLEKADIPATYTLMAAGVLSYGEPRNLGMLGMHGCYAANKAIDEADLVIAVGTRFSDRVALKPETFARRAKIIQIDIDPSELGKNVAVDLSLTGDASYILQAVLPHIRPTEHTAWRTQIAAWQKNDYKPTDSDTELKPHQIIREICRQAGPDAVYVTDVGQHQMWAAQFYKFKEPHQLLTSGGLGTMGYGLGAAIGAKVARPDKTVINMAGDGCFRMNMNEIATATRYNIPIIEIVFNNHVLGMVRQWQDLFYGKRYSSTVLNDKVDFVKLSEAMGAKAYKVTTKEEFEKVFTEALTLNEPVVIDCYIDSDDKVFPMVAPGAAISDIIVEEDLKNM